MNLLQGQHNFICGTTGTGKTYFALKQLEKADCPVFFFNPQKTDTRFTECNGRYGFSEIASALKAGEKLDYIPSLSLKESRRELNYLIQQFFKYETFRARPCLFCIDECHLVAAQGANNEYINMIPTRGRVYGFQGVFIAQRPALVDKTIVTQSTKHFIFHTEYEGQYFRSKGIDDTKVQELLGDSRVYPHRYIIYQAGQIAGPYQEGK